MPNTSELSVAKQPLSLRKFLRNRKNLLLSPSHVVVKGTMRRIDGLTIIAACAIERTPYIQEMFSSTSRNQLLANIVGGVIAFSVLNESKSYQIRRLKNFGSQSAAIGKAVIAGTGGVFVSLAVLHTDSSQIVSGPAHWAVVSGVALVALRLVTTPIIKHLATSGVMASKIAVVGVNELSEHFIKQTLKYSDTCKVVGLYDDRMSIDSKYQQHPQFCGSLDQLLLDSQKQLFDSIIITLPTFEKERLNEVYEKLHPAIADVCLAGEAVAFAQGKTKLREVGGNLVLTVNKKPLNEWQMLQKELFDRILGSVLLVAASPFLALTAIAIKIDSRGPVLFKQPRVGYNNLMFDTYKFRSMYAHMEDIAANQQTTRDDPRITKLGKYLRKYSIDELPQLLNVVNGTMSLVGPRPHAPGTKANNKLFHEVVSNYAARHRVKPGITGWAQINGWRGLTPTDESIQKRVEYDLYYIGNWSLWFDLKIMFLTIKREIKSKIAY